MIMKYVAELLAIFKLLDQVEARLTPDAREKKRSMKLLARLRVDVSTVFKHLEDLNIVYFLLFIIHHSLKIGGLL